MRIVLGVAGALLLAAAIGIFRVLPAKLDAGMNVVTAHEPYAISTEAQALHDDLRVADLHSDMLLWMRDPNSWNTRGHTDFPRLRAGHVALQVFSSVTKTPANMNYDSNTADSDNITPLAIVQLWPLESWTSIYARARYHARRLNRLATLSHGEFVVARTREDLAAALERRASDPDVLVGILATEGGHPFEGDLANIDGLYDEGYRMIGLQHFFDNELGGSLHGVSNAGLTDFGRAAVARIIERGMIIDLAHSSQAVVRDVLDMTDVPLVISHTGIHGHCEARRNIPDALMSEVAARGGVIGIGFWADVTCDDTPEGVAATILAAIELLGIEHVALGSDYDGGITATFDASEYAVLTDRLLAAGLSEADVRAVMGENTIRFFLANLPGD
ncbi:membrane dipeptidase [uncultured Maricaulis sp.]|uniref:dipeptidase n=1 Tax=uncultured Maricaulis sp. TaxID=174710 RepID=UPI0030DC563E|tara:strand:+ start:50317 stop:51483 length:1167 start_codon:yes stop_codon:yes gene_type:complete